MLLERLCFLKASTMSWLKLILDLCSALTISPVSCSFPLRLPSDYFWDVWLNHCCCEVTLNSKDTLTPSEVLSLPGSEIAWSWSTNLNPMQGQAHPLQCIPECFGKLAYNGIFVFVFSSSVEHLGGDATSKVLESTEGRALLCSHDWSKVR